MPATVNRKDTTVRHRIAGVHGQIHQHLIEERRVHTHAAGIAGDIQLKADALAEQSPDQRDRTIHDLGDLHRTRCHHVTTGKAEQLPTQRRTGFSRRANLPGTDGDITPGLRIERQQAGFADDRREHVIEIVRDAAGQLADALDALHLAQLIFQPTTIGDVDEHTVPQRRPVSAALR